MDLRLLYSVILTILPFTELRAGLPIAITFARDNRIPIFLVFLMTVLLNILIIFFIFYFLDNIHTKLMNIKTYKNAYEKFLSRFQKRVDKVEKRHSAIGFVALALFVAVPLPGMGAWSGSLISWLLDLDRKKSILAISIGVIIAGFSVLFGTLGVINLFT